MAERDLVVRIIGDDKSLRRALGRSDKDLTSFNAKVSRSASGLSRWGKAAGLAAAAGGVALGVGLAKSIGAASDLNEEISKSTVLFGKSSDQVNAWAKTTASAIGISRREALQAAGNFGAMFSTIGVGDKTSAQMSTRLVKLGADLASFSNQDPKEMLDKLRSGLAGEAEPLRRFGILLSEQRVKQEAVRLGLVKQGAELTEQQKVAARYSLILRDAGKANGDFARTSDSLANEQRVARAEIEDLSASIGNAFLPVAAKTLGVVNRLIPVLGQGAAAISSKVGPVIERVFAGVEKRLPALERLGHAIVDPLRRDVLPVLRDVGGILQTTFANVADVITQNSGQIRSTLGNIAVALRNVWTIARPTIVFLFTKVLPIALKISIRAIGVMSKVVRTLSEIWVRAVSIIVKAIDAFLGSLTFLVDAASHLPFVGDHFKGISDKINVAREGLSSFAGDLDALNGKQIDVGINIRTKVALDRHKGRPGPNSNVGDAATAAAAGIGEATAADIALGAALDTSTKTSKTTKTKAEKARDAFDALMATLGVALDKAEVTRRISDDLAVLRKEEAAVKAEIAIEGHTAELEGQLFEIRQRRLEKRREAVKTSQFLALGLTGEGDKRTPSAKALLRRVANLRDQIKGTPLDTKKTRTELARITKVLRGAFGKAGKDVRDAILSMLNDISGALSSGTKTGTGTSGTGELTRGGIRSTEKLIAGLGLTPEQEAAIRARNMRVTRRRGRISAFGFAIGSGTRTGTTRVVRGAGVGARDAGPAEIVINGPITVVSNDPDSFMRKLQKKSSRTAGSRRGRHGGVRLGLG
jgi:hypothetical protein